MEKRAQDEQRVGKAWKRERMTAGRDWRNALAPSWSSYLCGWSDATRALVSGLDVPDGALLWRDRSL